MLTKQCRSKIIQLWQSCMNITYNVLLFPRTNVGFGRRSTSGQHGYCHLGMIIVITYMELSGVLVYTCNKYESSIRMRYVCVCVLIWLEVYTRVCYVYVCVLSWLKDHMSYRHASCTSMKSFIQRVQLHAHL